MGKVTDKYREFTFDAVFHYERNGSQDHVCRMCITMSSNVRFAPRA